MSPKPDLGYKNVHSSEDGVLYYKPYVSEFEKRGNFAQNTIFCHFSAYHHFKPVRALGFRLGLQAVWTFYFTDPTLKARASPSGEPPEGHKTAFFERD